jgi:hypothetical protein
MKALLMSMGCDILSAKVSLSNPLLRSGFTLYRVQNIVKRSLIDLFRKVLALNVKRNIDNFLLECIQSKSIVLDPDYQREVVWDEGRAALLVTSLLSMLRLHFLRVN